LSLATPFSLLLQAGDTVEPLARRYGFSLTGGKRLRRSLVPGELIVTAVSRLIFIAIGARFSIALPFSRANAARTKVATLAGT